MEKIYSVKSVTGQVMNIYDDRVELTQEGLSGFFTQGLQGTKTYFFRDITTIQFKNCGWTNGFFEFTFGGGHDSRGGAWGGMNNDNRFVFGAPTIGKAKQIALEMESINNLLQEKLSESKSTKVSNASNISVADEILKFKNLLDSGIITQEEFEKKKSELLGL